MASCSARATRFLVVNGVPQAGDVPPISILLESLSGAYTTTRTHGNASLLLFWERHLHRLTNSARILSDRRPDLLGLQAPVDLSSIRPFADESLQEGLGLVGGSLQDAPEFAVTTMVCSSGLSRRSSLDLYLHVGFYVPPIFGATGARLALAGRGRDVADAKYSQWARVRKDLERMRPPMTTELLLSNDGDQILEGSVTNFFVVCTVNSRKADDLEKASSFVVQTAPISDGVLPGVIRQQVIEVCSYMGIPLREVAPLWSDREHWKEAFITSGLRLIQHVESVQAPTVSKDFHLRCWNEISWTIKTFEGIGFVTSQIQKEIMARLSVEAYPISYNR